MGYKQLRKSTNIKLWNLINNATKIQRTIKLSDTTKLSIRRITTNLVGVDVVKASSSKSGIYLLIDDCI